LFFLSVAKSDKRNMEQALPGGVDTSERGEEVGKGWEGEYGANTAYI
jgi:hypothetical protein